MGNFYDTWLAYWDEEQKERAEARKSIHEEELAWVRTKQDYRAAAAVSRENGFITAGATMMAEIPKGWHTGKHSHGEEAMFILEGDGFSIIDGKRYDWDTRTCLFIPYGAIHQHFNAGNKVVRYYSAMGLAAERFASLAKVVQYEEAGETYIGQAEGFEKAEADTHPEYGRIVLRQKDAPVNFRGEERQRTAATMTSAAARYASGYHHHNRFVQLMSAQNGFKNKETCMSLIMCDEPGTAGGKHAHMEAVIYILQGEGYSIIDGEKVEWKKGTTLHVQGPQTVHQHFNTGTVESQLLRMHYGLRAEFFGTVAERVFPYVFYETA
ncbi:MAG: cupin domain-containing protein [Chloroflexi bacterium]|nr:cupin domain-containing protein [Chloroflexota bacterium]